MKSILILVLILFLFSLVACAPKPIQELEDKGIAEELELEPEPLPEVDQEPEAEPEEIEEIPESLPESEPVPELSPESVKEDVIQRSELADVLEEIQVEEHTEPIVHMLLQNERGVYTYDRKRYVVYFRKPIDADTAEMSIEGETMAVDLGESVKLDAKNSLNLISIMSGGSETVGDLVKFYYGTRDGLIVDYIEEGETKTYLKNGVKYVITLTIVSNLPAPKVIFEINGKTTDSLESKDQEIFDDRSFLFVSNIFPNEAREFSAQKAVEFTITEN